MKTDRRKIIEDYRRDYPAETAGLADIFVEAMAYNLDDVATETLAHALRQRYFRVTLEALW